MLIRISLLSLLALAACSDDPKPAEPVVTQAEPALVEKAGSNDFASSTAKPAAPAPAKVEAAPKAGTKETGWPTPSTKPVIAVKAAKVTAVPAKLVTIPAVVTPAPSPEDKNAFWVFVDGANIRATPSLAGKIVGKLTWSQKVTALGEANGFIKLAEGQFVHRKMLTDRKGRFGTDPSAH